MIYLHHTTGITSWQRCAVTTPHKPHISGVIVSPYINRFTQPDSIIPNPANPQAFNRFSYVYNRPINFSDPSGHDPYWCMNNQGHDINDRCLYNYLEGRSQEGADLLFAKYGVTVDKGMNAREKRAIMAAIYEAGEKISEVIEGDESAAEAFSAAFEPITFTKSAVDYDGCVFQTINKVSCSDFTYDYFQSDVNNVVHELGHVLNAIVGGAANNFGWPYALQRSRILRPDVGIDWQQHPEFRREDPVWTGGEMFGDMLVAWVFDAWNQDELNIGYVNRARDDLTTNMTEWINR